MIMYHIDGFYPTPKIKRKISIRGCVGGVIGFTDGDYCVMENGWGSSDGIRDMSGNYSKKKGMLVEIMSKQYRDDILTQHGIYGEFVSKKEFNAVENLLILNRRHRLKLTPDDKERIKEIKQRYKNQKK